MNLIINTFINICNSQFMAPVRLPPPVSLKSGELMMARRWRKQRHQPRKENNWPGGEMMMLWPGMADLALSMVVLSKHPAVRQGNSPATLGYWTKPFG